MTRRNGLPETIIIDGSEANAAAIKSYNEEYGTTIVIRQVEDHGRLSPAPTKSVGPIIISSFMATR